MSRFILETNALTKSFGKQNAVDNISIHVKKGAIYGLIGRNGAGKTTFMKMITGLANPTSGGFTVSGRSGKELKTVRGIIGCHIEAPGLYPDLNAYRNLKCKCIQRGIKDEHCIHELLELVELSDAGKKKVKAYSLGMKQRLGIAMALVGNPEILVLDEPINGLDPQGIREVREMLLKLNQRGMTLMISSHILDELSKIATDYGIIHEGKLLEEITADALRTKCAEKVIIKTDVPEKAAAFLAKMQVTESVLRDGALEISGHIAETVSINTALVEAGIPVREIYVQAESLEAHYLRLTGGEEA